jgi:thioredoxin 1
MTSSLELTDGTFDEYVRSSTKPVLVDFWAPWCPPCKVLRPMIEQLGEEYEELFAVVAVDIDAVPTIAMRFSVMSVPTLLLLRDGVEIFRSIGAKPRSRLLGELLPSLA